MNRLIVNEGFQESLCPFVRGRCVTLTGSGSLNPTFSLPRRPNPARGAGPQLELSDQRSNQALRALFLTTQNIRCETDGQSAGRCILK